jgi:hypothetical protein
VAQAQLCILYFMGVHSLAQQSSSSTDSGNLLPLKRGIINYYRCVTLRLLTVMGGLGLVDTVPASADHGK